MLDSSPSRWGSRFFACVLPVLAFCALGGCAGRYAARDPGKVVAVEGTLTLRGGAPFPILLLSSGGETFLVRSDSLFEELKNIQGMPVRLEARRASAPSLGLPVLNVSSYRLMALPGQEEPLVGVLRAEGDACYLITGGEGSIELRGSLVGLLRGFTGSKVWLVGERSAAGMIVEGYGLILRAPGESSGKKRL